MLVFLPLPVHSYILHSEILWFLKYHGSRDANAPRIWGVQHFDYWQRLKALNVMSMQRRRERYNYIIIIFHIPQVENVAPTLLK